MYHREGGGRVPLPGDPDPEAKHATIWNVS
jgi:hypothetical protein